MFPCTSKRGNSCVRNNVSATMFPRLPRPSQSIKRLLQLLHKSPKSILVVGLSRRTNLWHFSFFWSYCFPVLHCLEFFVVLVVLCFKAVPNEDTLLLTQMFPCLPTRVTLLRTEILFPIHNRCFWFFFQKHFVSATNVFSFARARKHDKQQCVLVCHRLHVTDEFHRFLSQWQRRTQCCL